MPPKRETTRESILSAALCIVEDQGIDAVSARSVAQRLRCSTQPIYSLFDSMDTLRREVWHLALEEAQSHIRGHHDDRYLPELQLIIGYYDLARTRKALFRSVYQSTVSAQHPESVTVGREMLTQHLARSERLRSLPADGFGRVVLVLTVFINGLATMLNTGTLDTTLDQAADLTAEVYTMAVMKERARMRMEEMDHV